MPKNYTDKNVYDAAVERFDYIYAIYDWRCEDDTISKYASKYKNIQLSLF